METFNAVADAGVAGVAALDETMPLDVGASEELVGGAPAPNCPARKTWAALASFDLISGAVFDAAVDSVVGVDAVGDAGADVDIKLLPAAVAGAALPALVTCTLTAKLPLQAGVDCPFTPKHSAEEKMAGLVRLELVAAADENRCSLFLQLRDQGSSRRGGNWQVCVSLRRATHSIRIAAPERARWR